MAIAENITTIDHEQARPTALVRLWALLGHGYLVVLCRVALGAVFVFAGAEKIMDIGTFITTVQKFSMLPAPIDTYFAMALPWAEVVVGLFLILGFLQRTSGAIIGLMLVVFIIAIAQAIFRGLNLAGCGCFGKVSSGGGITWVEVARDLGFMALLLPVFIGNRAFLSLDGWLARRNELVDEGEMEEAAPAS